MEGKGYVYLVGAGPGDEGLITVKGKECIEEGDVVVYDYLINRRLLDYAKPGAEKIYVGKRGGSTNSSHQEHINRILNDKASEGKKVVRLKGGDPTVFGRGGEEALFLAKRGIPFEIVPGVSSVSAVPAYAGIPISHREFASCFIVATGHEFSEDGEHGEKLPWESLAGIPTIVFLMGFRNVGRIMEKLIQHGKDPSTPAALVSWGTIPRQRTVTGTVGDIAERVTERDMKPPSIVIVGEVVNLRGYMNWYEERPLFGKRIVVTRAREQAAPLVKSIERQGGEAIEFPVIAIAEPDSWEELDDAIGSLEEFDWIVFTSVNGVERFFRRLHQSGRDSRALHAIKTAAIGEQTARALERKGFNADVVPGDYIAEGLIREFRDLDIKGKRIVIPRAAEAREVLPEKLVEMGAIVRVVPAYKTITPLGGHVEDIVEEIKEMLSRGMIDAVTFTSSSTVRNFMELIAEPGLMTGVTLACIGPITAHTLTGLGFEPDIVCEKHTVHALVNELSNYYSHNPQKDK